MKHLKHILAAALTILMALAIATPALADEEPAQATKPSITIEENDAQDKVPEGSVYTQYEYYQLLHASIEGTGKNMKVTYYLLNGTDDALRTLLDAVTVDGSDLFTFTQSADGSRWNVTTALSDGEKISNALNTDEIKAAALKTGTFSQNNTGSVTATVDEQGYYLITSSLGTKLVLETLDNVTIHTKNEYITNAKTASKTNMNVGDTVTYTITVHVPATAVVDEEIIVHDTLDSHLEIHANTIAAKLGENEVALVDADKKAETETFAKKFVITNDMLGHDVVITYDAELLSTAATDTGYINSAFSNYADYETQTVTIDVWTFDFDLNKNFQGVADTDANASTYQATFNLYPQVTPEGSETPAQGENPIAFVTDDTGYVKADSKATNASPNITVDQVKNVNIRGLEAGTYYLVETATADGYNLLTEPILVTITDEPAQGATEHSHIVSYVLGGTNANGTVTVVNQSGVALPSTGGIGTTIFYVVGGAMVITAAVLLITKRRMSKLDK